MYSNIVCFELYLTHNNKVQTDSYIIPCSWTACSDLCSAGLIVLIFDSRAALCSWHVITASNAVMSGLPLPLKFCTGNIRRRRFHFHFWATVCKTWFALCYLSVVCLLSVLSAPATQFSAHICCGQMGGWIKLPHGREVGLGPRDIVLDGNPAPLPKKGAEPLPNFRPMSIVAKRLGRSKWHLA